MKKVHDTTTFLLVTLPDIHRFKKIFTDRLSNKPFLIWLFATLPHLKYVATLPCNLSLIACFLTSHMRGVVRLLTTLLQICYRIFQWKKFLKRLRFDRIMATSVWPRFFWPNLYVKPACMSRRARCHRKNIVCCSPPVGWHCTPTIWWRQNFSLLAWMYEFTMRWIPARFLPEILWW